MDWSGTLVPLSTFNAVKSRPIAPKLASCTTKCNQGLSKQVAGGSCLIMAQRCILMTPIPQLYLDHFSRNDVCEASTLIQSQLKLTLSGNTC
ncbi:Uncharacterized protein HZ326_17981 [Fusarium oxysporum f. sp. albedinis]|nr:Uncharacterized protein HZ326_17981 [Fusarium oxysporum f. sp. albedinis]